MIYQVLEYLRHYWGMLVGKTSTLADETSGAGISLDPRLLLGIIILLTICMASSFWAGSIAGSRRHPLLLHALIGAVAPIAYPATIMFTLDLQGAKEREQAKLDEEAAAEAEEAERVRLAEVMGRSPTPEDEDAGAEAESETFDEEYFKRISRNETGQLTGPWLISYNNQSVCALNIAECLDQVVVVEIETPGGDRQRIRIRYVLIEGCEHA
ncbi:MAG: hypothetical protein HN849_21995 [Victivallales bacterium]|nr:hypothetical protein [Victivallales bacterium]MBT7166024.1 hypothetical protein [Victivallales bacterium]MBT7302216.1 hypothetical protein [Victivallales bacterium]